MAGLDHELESVIVDLSADPFKHLPGLDDAALVAMLRTAGGLTGSSARLWNNDQAAADACQNSAR